MPAATLTVPPFQMLAVRNRINRPTAVNTPADHCSPSPTRPRWSSSSIAGCRSTRCGARGSAPVAARAARGCRRDRDRLLRQTVPTRSRRFMRVEDATRTDRVVAALQAMVALRAAALEGPSRGRRADGSAAALPYGGFFRVEMLR